MTQGDLAAKAGVSLSTVYHVEVGARVRRSSIQKICGHGLDTTPEALSRTRAKRRQELYLLYRSEYEIWHTEQDRRPRIPEDSLARIQDLAERRRLGRLGFVPSFVNNPNIVMAGGPGTVFIELHGRREGPINSDVYRDAKLYCQSVGLRCGLLGRVVELNEGDMIGYRSQDLDWIEPLTPLGASDTPPLLLWMGAVRIGKAVNDAGRTIVRKPRKTV